MRVPPVSYDSWDLWDGRVRHAMARDHRTACPVCWAYAAYTAYSSRKSCTAGPAFRPVSRHCREPAPQGPGNAKRRKDFSCRQCVVGSPFREAVKSPLFNDDAPGRNGRCLATPYYTYIPPLLLYTRARRKFCFSSVCPPEGKNRSPQCVRKVSESDQCQPAGSRRRLLRS